MTDIAIDMARLRAALEADAGAWTGDDDYRIAAIVGSAFLARGRNTFPALLIPLRVAPQSVGRRGGGFTLSGADRVRFRSAGRVWEQAAATLECTEPEMIGAFLALVVDIATRLGTTELAEWPVIVGWVEEWQELLARRQAMDLERQLGLWGELSVIAGAAKPDLMVAGWRGPDRDATDFFLDGIALEVKASRRPHVHHVSQRQVVHPAGHRRAYVLSFWAGIDPVRGSSVAELVDALLARVSDPPALLRRLARLGYAPIDSAEYATRFISLDAPRWFDAESVPRVRTADPGVSELRYVVALDLDRALDELQANELFAHFGTTLGA